MSALAAFGLLLTATALVRLGEVAVSLRRIARRPAALVPEPGLFPLMVALHVGFVLLPLVEVVALHRPYDPRLGAVAGAVFGVATTIRIWTLWHLRRSWNVRVLAPSEVTTTGPYRWLRHPNYAVVVLEIASLPLIHGAWVSALLLSVCNGLVLRRRIRTEEAVLMQLPAWRAAFDGRARLLPGVW